MRLILTAALTAALLTGCAEDVSKGKVEAEVKEAPAAAEEKPADAAAEGDAPADAAAEGDAPADAATAGDAWTVDAATSKISALGAKVTGTHNVGFGTFTGSVNVDGENVVAIAFEVDMNSMLADPEKDGGNKKLTGHLMSPDFFNVAENPTSTFASTSVTAGSDTEGMSHTVKGNLTMAGKTMEVSFPAALSLADGAVTANTEFAINRQDWGIAYPGKPDDLIQDKVVLTISLTAAKG